jgi:hypothetical protein
MYSCKHKRLPSSEPCEVCHAERAGESRGFERAMDLLRQAKEQKAKNKASGEMTLDEAIDCCRGDDDSAPWPTDKQLVEWLEELKRRRVDSREALMTLAARVDALERFNSSGVVVDLYGVQGRLTADSNVTQGQMVRAAEALLAMVKPSEETIPMEPAVVSEMVTNCDSCKREIHGAELHVRSGLTLCPPCTTAHDRGAPVVVFEDKPLRVPERGVDFLSGRTTEDVRLVLLNSKGDRRQSVYRLEDAQLMFVDWSNKRDGGKGIVQLHVASMVHESLEGMDPSEL